MKILPWCVERDNIEPITDTEKLMFSTVRLTCPSNGVTGTGFFVEFVINDVGVVVLVTNKHVINYNPNEMVTFRLHLTNPKDCHKSIEELVDITLQNGWIFHSYQDLCFMYANSLIKEVYNKTQKSVFLAPISEKMINNSVELECLSMLEPVIMIGYPNGLWDEIHIFPLFRTGYTSYHPAYDLNKKGIGVVDMACYGGSSGSPIFIHSDYGYFDKNKGKRILKNRLMFLGVLQSGPVSNVEGEMIEEKFQNKQIPRMKTLINLGYYIKGYELLEFKEYIQKQMFK